MSNDKQNIISFSLWGNDKRYLKGALDNCKLAPIIYPEWKLRYHINSDISKDFASELHSYGADVYLIPDNKGPFYGMYWRFFVNDDPNVNHYIIRDCDSQLNWRERAAVDEWLKSDKPFHIMRDHQNHYWPIQGGMWGGTTGHIINIQNLIAQWNMYDRYACDQYFLKSIIYPMIKDKSIVHDPYFEKKPFPPHEPILNGGWFVGQIFNGDGIPQKQ